MRTGTLRFAFAAAISCALVGCRSTDQVAPPEVSSDVEHAKAAWLLNSYRGRGEPVPVYIDGQRYVSGNGSGEFNVIDPNRIASVRLLTGAEAEAVADVDGRNGVIWITTKQSAESRR